MLRHSASRCVAGCLESKWPCPPQWSMLIRSLGGFVIKLQSLWYFLRYCDLTVLTQAQEKGKFWKLSVSLIKCCHQSYHNGSNNDFIFWRATTVALLSYVVIHSEDVASCKWCNTLFGLEGKKQHCSLWSNSVRFSMHPSIVYPHFPLAGGAYPSCRCARATWKDIQPLTLTHTPTGNLEFFNCPHMYVFGLCEGHANSAQKGSRPRY